MGFYYILTSTLFLHHSFASYNALSALASKEFTSSDFLRLTTQILIVTFICFHSLSTISISSTSFLILSENTPHHFIHVSGKIITNSSQPYLAKTSFDLILTFIFFAIVFKTKSQDKCQYVSLTFLK